MDERTGKIYLNPTDEEIIKKQLRMLEQTARLTELNVFGLTQRR